VGCVSQVFFILECFLLVVTVILLTVSVLASARASEGLLRKEEGILPSPLYGAPPAGFPAGAGARGAGPRREGLM